MTAPLYRYWLTQAWQATSRMLVRAEGDPNRRAEVLAMRCRIREGYAACIVVVCAQCGRPFETATSTGTPLERRRYCSPSCQEKAQYAQRRLRAALSRQRRRWRAAQIAVVA